MFRRLELPDDRARFVERMVALHLRPIALVRDGVTDAAIRRLQADAGEHIEQLLALCRADITSKNPALVRRYLRNYEILRAKIEEVGEADRLRAWQPPLRGEEIMAICGIEPGILIGVLKTRVEDAILDGRIPNTHEAAVAYLMEIKDEVLALPAAAKHPSVKRTLKRLPANLRT
jgi:poly(A) polymerase